MYKLEVKLKQHTPIIHFQGDQQGATLRASELKPKLDKYLIDMVFENEFENLKTFLVGYNQYQEKGLYERFLLGYSALDYKVCISAEKTNIKVDPIPEKFPCFFGNMGEENSILPKVFSFVEGFIYVNFKTDHSILQKHLKSELPNFFARNNFGTRQSKGFGSFYIDQSDPIFELPQLFSHFTINAGKNEFKKIFADIEIVHKVIRSGINEKGREGISLFYMKPLIWQYFREQGVSWEKRTIKQQFYVSILNRQMHDHTSESDGRNWPLFFDGGETKIVKDLMGLSSSEQWLTYNKDKIEKQSPTVDRMKSPFFYKPISERDQFKVYIGFDYFNQEFLDKEFGITNGKREFLLKTPKQFDIDDFFFWCFKKIDISRLIAQPYRDSSKAQKIKRIFSELKRNLNG